MRVSNIKHRFGRLKNGSLALLFLAAYGISALAPFMNTSAIYADGNNGTVKINDLDTGSGSQNVPILTSCSVVVKWFGFDEGQQIAKVKFEAQAPTKDQLASPLGEQSTLFTGSGPGDTLDHTETYTLSFTGAPGSHGYKAKVTVDTTYANNTQNKSKVFWLPASCGQNVSAEEVKSSDPCGIEHDTYTIPDTNHVEYYIDNIKQNAGQQSTNGAYSLEVTAKAVDGYTLEGQSSWHLTFNNEACPEINQPPEPTIKEDPCGTKDDAYIIPDASGVKYYLQSDLSKSLNPGEHKTKGARSVTIVAVAEDDSGYTKNNSWTLTFTDVSCEEGPVPIPYPSPTVIVVCGPNNDEVTLPTEMEHVTMTHRGWKHGKYVVTAKTNPGYYFQGTDGKTKLVWKFIDANTECGGGQGEGQPVPLLVPGVEVVCGANNDKVTLPVVENVSYSQTGWVDGKNTVTATVAEGHYIAGTEGEMTMKWVLTDANTSCGNVLSETTTTPNVTLKVAAAAQLENTGNSIVFPMLMSTGVLGLAFMTLLQNDKRSGRLAKRVQKLFEELSIALGQPFILPTA